MDRCICSSQRLDLIVCSSGLLEFCTCPSRKCDLAACQTLQSSAESSCSPGASVEVHWWMASCVGPSSTSLLSNFSNPRRKQPAVEEQHLSQSSSEGSGRNLHWRDGAELLSHRVRNPETKCLTYSYMAVVDKSQVNSSRVFQHMFWHNPWYSSTLGQCQSPPPSLFLAQVQQEKCWGSSSLGEECGDHEYASKPKQFERTTSRTKLSWKRDPDFFWRSMAEKRSPCSAKSMTIHRRLPSRKDSLYLMMKGCRKLLRTVTSVAASDCLLLWHCRDINFLQDALLARLALDEPATAEAAFAHNLNPLVGNHAARGLGI